MLDFLMYIFVCEQTRSSGRKQCKLINSGKTVQSQGSEGQQDKVVPQSYSSLILPYLLQVFMSLSIRPTQTSTFKIINSYHTIPHPLPYLIFVSLLLFHCNKPHNLLTNTTGYNLSIPTRMEASQGLCFPLWCIPQCLLKQCTSYAHYTYLYVSFI